MNGVNRVLERRKRIKEHFTFGVILSLLLHSAVAAFIILAPRWTSSKEERYITVELISLPKPARAAKKKTVAVKKREEAPKPPKKEEKALVLPKEGKKREKERKKPVKREKVKKQSERKPIPPKQMGREATISGGLRGGDISLLNIHNIRFLWYQTIVTSILRSNWATAVAGEEARGKKVVVMFTIKKNGEISGVKLVKRSGIFTLDQAVLRAILNSSPLPPIPEEFGKEELIAEYEFVY